MPIEIEKKYRLTRKQRDEVVARLPAIGAKRIGEEFEENTLYASDSLDAKRSVLRLRRIGNSGILTYKERFPTRSDIKHQQEDETGVDDPEAMASILDAIGFTPALLYEKRRETWQLGETEIVMDELPFGLFMEIEGEEADILHVEGKLAVKPLKAEAATYPQLTRTHGVDRGGVIEARFNSKK
ncbi:MAG: class IV adenylate cyclase [Acidobacteriota bacterium]